MVMNMSKQEEGVERFKNGFNCAQAVFSTFCQEYGIEKDTALRIAGGLGSGARSADICGAASGAILVIGLRYGQDSKGDLTAKDRCNKETEEFLRLFRERNGHTVCRELLGCDIFTEEGKRIAEKDDLFKSKCVDLVGSAISILEEMGY